MNASRRTRLAWLIPLALVAACARPTLNPEGPATGRGEIESVLRDVDAAIDAHDLSRVLSAYDASDSSLSARARGMLEGWFTLDSLRVVHRLSGLTGQGDTREAIVFQKATYREYGRDQAQESWGTFGFRRTPSGWKIASDEDRAYARCIRTDLTVQVLPDSGRMRGTSILRIGIEAPGEDNLLFQLNRGLAVVAIRDGDGKPVAFERVADCIEVPQSTVLRDGDQRSLAVSFEGALFNDSREQGYSQVSLAPKGCFASWVTNWYPRLAGIGSKSPGRITYDVPAGMTVASSGAFAGRQTQGGRERQVFTVDRPLDFSFAAANYFHREDLVDGIHLGIYLLSGGDAKAAIYLKECARTLRFERDLYGMYPFDGYAIVEIPSEETGGLGGSSEQGMNLFPVGVLPDTTFPRLLIGHEMGHSWWGNLVDAGDGPIIDEGLAQMTAVLCVREFEGERAMRRFLRSGAPSYAQSAREYFGMFAGKEGSDLPLGVAPASAQATMTLHDLADRKGDFVYTMLRDRIGAEPFVRGLRSIVSRFAGKTVKLSDLREAWEKASGQNLRAFFQEWFYRSGAPEFDLRSTTAASGAGFVTAGTIDQAGEPYDVDAEIALLFHGRRQIEKIAVSGPSTPFSFRSDERPDAIVFDPDYKILRWTGAIRNHRLLAEGETLLSLGRTEEAIAKLEDFAAKAPDDPEGQYHLGLCYQEAGRLDRAEGCFRTVIELGKSLDPEDPTVGLSALHLGQVCDLAGRRDDAKAAYFQALALPDESGSHRDAEAGIAAPYRRQPKASPPGPEKLSRYAGTYDTGKGLAVRVAVNKDGLLTAAQPGKPEGALEWMQGSRFGVAGMAGVTLEFVGDSTITGVDVRVGNALFHVPRVP